MKNKNLLLCFLDSIQSVVLEKKDYEIAIKDFEHAKVIFQEILSNHNDLISFFEDLKPAMQNMNKNDKERVFKCICILYVEVIAFEEECIRIVRKQ